MNVLFRFNDKSIWRVMNTTLLVCIGLSCAKSLLGISVIGIRIILTSLIMIFIVMLTDRMSVRGRLLGLAGIGAVLFGVSLAVGFDQCLLFAGTYCRWLVNNRAGWQEEWIAGYEVVQTVILVWLAYLFALFTEKNFRLKVIGSAAFLIGILYALFNQKEMSKQGVAFLICYVVLTYAEWTQRRWKKEKDGSIQAYMMWIVPFVAVYFVLIMLCAVPDEPYDWKFVKNVYQHLAESFKKVSQNIVRRGSEDYVLSLNGFSENGNIGGGRLENEREIMKIWDADGLVTNVYLCGDVYDTFDGRQWLCFSEDASKERYMDTVETMYAVRRYDNKYFTDYMKYAEFKIDYQYFRSGYLFAPLKLSNVIYRGESFDFREKAGSLFFDKAKGYGTEYAVSFYQLNVGQDIFNRFLREAGDLQEDGEILASLLKDLEKRTGAQVTADDLTAHRQEVYAHYTENVELSDDVQEYIDEVTEGAQTNAEKLEMIEAELAGYDYTLQPEVLPGTVTDSGEFLDYFLLDARAGYCSHFATAFVLLARAQGLPARYVQGFCVPFDGEEEKAVLANMAHAWPEVYLDGIGWIPYEPTPGYQQVRYTPWTLINANDDSDGGQGVRSAGGEKLALAQPEYQEEAKTEGSAAVEDLWQIVRLMGIALAFAVAFIIVIWVLNRLIAAYRYRRMNAEQKLRMKVHQNMQIMLWMGIGREQETLEEFRIRVQDLLPDKDLLRFVEKYEGVLYGNDEADYDMIDLTQKQQEELLLLLRKKRRWLYIYCRFLMRSK